jgi:hypothetical protein
MVGMVRRSAYEQIAHLLCEMLLRLRAVGLVQDDSFDLPLSQEQLGKEALRAVGEAARDFARQRGAGVLAVEVRDDSGPILGVSATIEITALSKTFPEEA